MSTVNIPSHVEIDVRRPNGDVETITHPTFKSIRESDFAKIKAATAKAGKGECLGYRNVEKAVASYEPTAAELASDKHYYATKAIYAASASGESCDDAADNDNTHAAKSDY